MDTFQVSSVSEIDFNQVGRYEYNKGKDNYCVFSLGNMPKYYDRPMIMLPNADDCTRKGLYEVMEGYHKNEGMTDKEIRTELYELFVAMQYPKQEIIEEFPQLVEVYEEIEQVEAPARAKRAYDEYKKEHPDRIEAVISNDGEIMNTSEQITAANIAMYENKGLIDSDSMNSRSIRNEGTGKSGEEIAEKRKEDEEKDR